MSNQVIYLGTGRSVNGGNPVFVGAEHDNLSERVIFAGLPELDAAQSAFVAWVLNDGTEGDVVALTKVDDGWAWDVTSALTQYAGHGLALGAIDTTQNTSRTPTAAGYIHITAGADTVWNSRPFAISILPLPDAAGTVTAPELSAIDQMLAAIATHNTEMADALKAAKVIGASVTTLAAGANATVTRTETADGVSLALGIPRGDTGAAGPNIVNTTTDSNILGILKGSGGKVAQAVGGTDYATPAQVDAVASQLAAIDTRVEILEDAAVHRYGVLWDGVNAQCVRTRDAAGIPTTTTNFGHFGAVNTGKANPFDILYPWSGRCVVNVNMATYASLLASGGDIKGCISAYFGDPGFKLDGTNGPVMVYTPEFWMKETPYGGANGGREIIVADGALDGYTHVPAMVGGRWFGVDDGAGGLTSKPGMPLINVAMSTIHARAKAVGMTLDDIYTYSATNALMVVEYAKMDTQAAIGNGDSSSYRQSGDVCSVAASAAEYVVVTNAVAANYRVGMLLDIGTTNGGYEIGRKIITSITTHDASNMRLNFTSAITTTTASYLSAHGMANTEDSALGNDSGYIGTNGYCHAYYRGQISHGGRYRYLLGAYRQTGTGHIWVATSRAECDLCDALDTAKHLDTGLALAQNVDGSATEGYIKTLGRYAPLPLLPICTVIGGSSSAPVGDYLYNPALAAANTVPAVGGCANGGSTDGRFYGDWYNSAAISNWACAGVPSLKNP